MRALRVLLLTGLIASSMAMNPYEELGVSSRASPEQIKKVSIFYLCSFIL